MNMSFQITEDDIMNVLDSHNVDLKDSIECVMEIIDDNEIDNAALSVDIGPEDDDDDILMKQTDAAYDEIAWQLFQAGFISENQISKYGNPDLLKKVIKN